MLSAMDSLFRPHQTSIAKDKLSLEYIYKIESLILVGFAFNDKHRVSTGYSLL